MNIESIIEILEYLGDKSRIVAHHRFISTIKREDFTQIKSYLSSNEYIKCTDIAIYKITKKGKEFLSLLQDVKLNL